MNELKPIYLFQIYDNQGRMHHIKGDHLQIDGNTAMIWISVKDTKVAMFCNPASVLRLGEVTE